MFPKPCRWPHWAYLLNLHYGYAQIERPMLYGLRNKSSAAAAVARSSSGQV
jgi:hypothetical protein